MVFVCSILFLLLSETRETSSLPCAGTWVRVLFDFQETRISPFFLAFSVECTSLTRSQEGFTVSFIEGTLLDQGSGILPMDGALRLL